MKSQILKLIALIALLTAGGFSSSAQNNGSALSSANNPVSSSTAFAIDKNIISFEVANLVDKIIYEHAPYPNYGGFPEAWSPHFWTITLIMAEGTDVTSLAPIITLAPGATITSKHAGVQDFSQQIEYTVICEDGSTVTYLFLAYTQENTRAMGTIIVNSSPSGGGMTTPPGSTNYDDRYPFGCSAIPNQAYTFERWYVNGSPKGTNAYFNDIIPLINGKGTLTAVFAPKVYYTVSVSSDDTNKGTVSGGGTVVAGGSVYISATPKSGYAFEGWYLYVSTKISGSASFYYQPSSNCALSARFVAQYTVTAQSEDTNKGTVSGGGTVAAGSTVVVAAIPKPGYLFEGWYLNSVKISGVQNFTHIPSASCTLTAKFVAPYTVTVQSEDTNKGTVSGGGSVAPGGSVSVSATPKSGYAFEGWYLNGTKIPGSTSFNYYPSANCSLIAKFISPPGISGSTWICFRTPKSFEASNWQSGYYWEATTNGNIVNITCPTCSTTNISAANSNSIGLVAVSIKNSSGATLATFRDIWVGPPLAYIRNESYIEPITTGTGYIYQAWTSGLENSVQSGHTSNYIWTVTGGGYYIQYFNPDCAVITFSDKGVQYTIELQVSNVCGYSSIASYYETTSWYSPAAYPNPASNILNIEINQEAIAQAKSPEQSTTNTRQLKTDPTYDIRLYDGQGNLLRNAKTKGGSVQFNVANLKNGIYYLHIYDGVNEKPEMRQIVVEH